VVEWIRRVIKNLDSIPSCTKIDSVKYFTVRHPPRKIPIHVNITFDYIYI